MLCLGGALVVVCAAAIALLRANRVPSEHTQRKILTRLLDEMRQLVTAVVVYEAFVRGREAGLLAQSPAPMPTSALRLRNRFNDLVSLVGSDAQWRKQSTDLAEMARLAVIRHLPGFELSGMSLDCNITDGTLWVDAVPAMLERVLDLCLQQALDATVSGPVSVNVRKSGRSILVEIQAGFSDVEDRLDLLLTRAIVERHGGSFALHRANRVPPCIRLEWPAARI